MKRMMNVVRGLLVLFVVSLFAAPAVLSEEAGSAPALTIDRMVISENIVDREPAGVADTFSADVGKVYCFIEAKDIQTDTTISFVWYFHGNQMAKVDLNIKQGDRWRTYASKNLGGLKGDWKVEIQDQNEVILKIAEFKVQ